MVCCSCPAHQIALLLSHRLPCYHTLPIEQCLHPKHFRINHCFAADNGNTAADCKQLYASSASEDWAAAWQRVLFELIAALPTAVTRQVQAVAFDGTSSTSMLVDGATGRVLCAPKLYDEAQGPEAVQAAKVGLFYYRGTVITYFRTSRPSITCEEAAAVMPKVAAQDTLYAAVVRRAPGTAEA